LIKSREPLVGDSGAAWRYFPAIGISGGEGGYLIRVPPGGNKPAAGLRREDSFRQFRLDLSSEVEVSLDFPAFPANSIYSTLYIFIAAAQLASNYVRITSNNVLVRFSQPEG